MTVVPRYEKCLTDVRARFDIRAYSPQRAPPFSLHVTSGISYGAPVYTRSSARSSDPTFTLDSLIFCIHSTVCVPLCFLRRVLYRIPPVAAGVITASHLRDQTTHTTRHPRHGARARPNRCGAAEQSNRGPTTWCCRPSPRHVPQLPRRAPTSAQAPGAGGGGRVTETPRLAGN